MSTATKRGTRRKPAKTKSQVRAADHKEVSKNQIRAGGVIMYVDSEPTAESFTPIQRAFVERATTFLKRIAREVTTEVLSHALGRLSPTGSIAYVLGNVEFEPTLVSAPDRALLDAVARGNQLKEELVAQAGGAMSATKFGELVGIGTRQGVAQGRRDQRFLGVPVAGNKYVYPNIQLTDRGVIAGLQDFLSAFQTPDPWTQLMVLLAPSPRLGGQRPIDALRSGAVAEAVQIARAYGEHGA